MNLPVLAQDTLQVPELGGAVLQTILALTIGAILGGWLLATKNIGLKLLGMVITVGSVVFALDVWNTPTGWQLAAGVGVVLLVSVAQLMQGGAGTRVQKIVLFLTAVLAVLALTVVLPGAFTEPVGTVGDIFVAGWNTIVEMINIAEDAVPGV